MKLPHPYTLLLALLVTACQGHPDQAQQAAHLTAVAVRQRAVDVTERMADRRPSACRFFDLDEVLERGQSHIANVRVTTSLATPQGDYRSLVDVVQLRTDPNGNIVLTETNQWSEYGWQGTRRRELRRVDGTWYLSEDGLPFVAPPAHDQRGLLDVREALSSWNRVLAMVPGWSLTRSGQRHLLSSGGRLRCPLRGDDRRIWFAELGEQLRLKTARASWQAASDASEHRLERQFFGVFEDIETGTVLTLGVDRLDHADPEQLPVLAPSEVADNQVPRDFFTIRALLGRTIRRRVLPPALRPPIPERQPAPPDTRASLSPSADDRAVMSAPGPD